jgi:ketosteroid isomerase-like protein
MMKRVLAGCLLLVIPYGVFGQVGTRERAALGSEKILVKAEHDWAKAVVDRDVLFLDRILSDDFVGWDYEGNRYTKADSTHDLSSGEWATKSLGVEDINVRVFGNTAVVTSQAIRRGEYKGQDNIPDTFDGLRCT